MPRLHQRPQQRIMADGRSGMHLRQRAPGRSRSSRRTAGHSRGGPSLGGAAREHSLQQPSAARDVEPQPRRSAQHLHGNGQRRQSRPQSERVHGPTATVPPRRSRRRARTTRVTSTPAAPRNSRSSFATRRRADTKETSSTRPTGSSSCRFDGPNDGVSLPSHLPSDFRLRLPAARLCCRPPSPLSRRRWPGSSEAGWTRGSRLRSAYPLRWTAGWISTHPPESGSRTSRVARA